MNNQEFAKAEKQARIETKITNVRKALEDVGKTLIEGKIKNITGYNAFSRGMDALDSLERELKQEGK